MKYRSQKKVSDRLKVKHSNCHFHLVMVISNKTRMYLTKNEPILSSEHLFVMLKNVKNYSDVLPNISWLQIRAIRKLLKKKSIYEIRI